MYKMVNGVLHDHRGPYRLESQLEIDWWEDFILDRVYGMCPGPEQLKEKPDIWKYQRNDLYPELD